MSLVLLLLLPLASACLDEPAVQVARLTDEGRDVIRPCWSPDGKALAFARVEAGGSAIWQYVLGIDPASPPGRLTGRTTPEYHGVFSPDGGRLLLTVVHQSGTQGDCDLAVINADGSGFAVLFDGGGGLSHQEWPSWAPNGRRFAFSSTHEGNQEIYVGDLGAGTDAVGAGLVRLSQSTGIDAHPSWSPIGDRIVFATDRWGGLELASVAPDGTGLARLTESPGLDDHPAVSPDGRRVAFVSNRDGQFEIYVLDLDRPGPALNLTRHPGRDTMPAWTPDGRRLTFVSDRDGEGDLYLIEVDPTADQATHHRGPHSSASQHAFPNGIQLAEPGDPRRAVDQSATANRFEAPSHATGGAIARHLPAP